MMANSNKHKPEISVHLSGLAAVLVILALLRWAINRLFLTRARDGLFR